MPDLREITASIRDRLDDKEKARETVLQSTRQIVRNCRSAIACIQTGNDPSADLANARNCYISLRKTFERYPDFFYSGYAMAAQQELAEAEILKSVIIKREIATSEEIGVSDEAFILGLADAIGEMRRIFLQLLLKDEIDEAKVILNKMEDFFSILMTFDYPDALLPAKRKQDVARSLLEKCRSELVMTMQMLRLREELRGK